MKFLTRLDQYVVLVLTVDADSVEKLTNAKAIALQNPGVRVTITPAASLYVDESARAWLEAVPELGINAHYKWVEVEAAVPDTLAKAEYCSRMDLTLFRGAGVGAGVYGSIEVVWEEGDFEHTFFTPDLGDIWKKSDWLSRAKFVEEERKKFYDKVAFKLPFGGSANVTYRCESTGKVFNNAAALFDHVAELNRQEAKNAED